MYISFGYKNDFSSILRALAAIGIGLVMIIANNATITVVKIIAAFLMAAGVVSLIRGLMNRNDGTFSLMLTNAIVDIVLGLLLFFYPTVVGNFIVYFIGIVLIGFGAMQLLALTGVMSLIGLGFASLLLSIICIIGGIFLLFNPFSMEVMSIISGCLLVLYGIAELISAYRMNKARKAFVNFNKPDNQQAGSSVKGGKVDDSGIKDAVDAEFHKVEDNSVEEQ